MIDADSSVMTPRGRAAWKAIQPLLRKRGVFWDGRASGAFELFCLAESYGAYRMTLIEHAKAEKRLDAARRDRRIKRAVLENR